jgi:kynureninase
MATTGVDHVKRVMAELGNLAPLDARVAMRLDETDALSKHREEFKFPYVQEGKPQIYFAGNSLGLQHRDVAGSIEGVLNKWHQYAVEGWWQAPEPWRDLDEAIRADVAKIVGAKKEEVGVMNALTVNLHLLMLAFYKPKGDRRKILCEQFPFPSDMHAFVSQAEHHGLTADDVVTIGDNAEPAVITTETFLEAIEKHGDTTAVLVVAAVHFLSGQYFDVPRIVKAAQAKGIIVGVDGAHAVGNVDLQLHDWNVDFAVWCHYKYLNAGPGAVGGAFVHERHCVQQVDGDAPSFPAELRGWWGHHAEARFGLQKTFRHAPGIAAYQISTPPIIALASLRPSIQFCARVGIANLRAKSRVLTGYLEVLLRHYLSHALHIITPLDENQRGAQIAVAILEGGLKEADASELSGENDFAAGSSPARFAQRQLLKRGIIVDNRPPNVLRLSPAPSYNSFEDVRLLIEGLIGICRAA